MKRNIYIILFGVLFFLPSCHQLNMGVIEKADDSVSEELSEIAINDGDSERIIINYGETNSVLLRTENVQNNGYFKVTLSRSSGYLSFSNIEIKVFKDDPYLGNSQYEVISNEVNSDTWEYFFLSDGTDKVITLNHDNEENFDLNIYDISITSHAYAIEEFPVEGNFVEETISPGETMSSNTNFFSNEIFYRHNFQELIFFQEYQLVITLDSENSVLPFSSLNSQISWSDSNYTIDRLYSYHSYNVYAAIFRVFPEDGSTEYVNDSVYLDSTGYVLGSMYSLTLEEAAIPAFTDDVFEPDQGPIAPIMDMIDVSSQSSAVHSITHENEDWIQFQPWGVGDYKISLQLEGAWYIDALVDGVVYVIQLSLVNQNGAEIEDQIFCRIYEPPIAPILCDDSIHYTLEIDTGLPLFVVVKAFEEIHYSILIEKIN
ncbi:MAG: hypothetical protein JEY91_07180 [Spirochaetaceae bacterium]|nr:hypothetical protein [Spirochaetaceae bacterium]